MPWRFWARSDPEPNDKAKSPLQEALPLPALPSPSPAASSTSSKFTPTQTVAIALMSTATALGLTRVYKSRIRRIPTVDYLKPHEFRQRSLYGYVTRVGDGDNFHLFHTPGGRLTGWGWLRTISTGRKLKGKTLHVRLAGVDAPELSHFGKPEQPFAKEALNWLKSELLHKHVRVQPWSRDQYERVVCTVYRRKWVVWKTDVGLEMIKRGLATVYEAKNGSEFGGKEEAYRKAEEVARRKKLGMWQKPGLFGKWMGRKESTESPREFKTRMASQQQKQQEATPDTGSGSRKS